MSCFADPSERASFWDGLPVPTTRAEERRYLARTIALAQRCGARNGDRRHSFLGESTGTLIGQSYANLSPRRVRAMVLDGVEDPVRFTAGRPPRWPRASPTSTGPSSGWATWCC